VCCFILIVTSCGQADDSTTTQGQQPGASAVATTTTSTDKGTTSKTTVEDAGGDDGNGDTNGDGGDSSAPASADVEDVLRDYFEAYYERDPDAEVKRSVAWAQRYSEVRKVQLEVQETLPPPIDAKLSVHVDRVEVDGDDVVAEGNVTAVFRQKPDTYADERERTIVFSDFVLREDDKKGLALADFSTDPSDGYGPLEGRLSDQVGYTGGEVRAGDLTINVGPAFRRAGLGEQSVIYTYYFRNGGSTMLTLPSGGGLNVVYSAGGERGSMADNSIYPTELPPGKGTLVVFVANKPSSWEDGEPVPEGLFEFDAINGGRTEVALPGPPFPAVF